MEPDLVVLTGDIALDRGSLELYRAVEPHLERAGADVVLLPGNHDRRELFHEAFGRRYRMDINRPTLDRVIESGGRRMLVIDSADGVIHDHTLQWADSILASFADAAARGDHRGSVIVWTHHPPLGGFHRFMDRLWALKNGEDFVNLCGRYRDSLRIHLFCGHYHTEHSMGRDNVTQHCTPSTWLQLDTEAENHKISSTVPAIRLIDLDDDDNVTTAVIEPVS